MMILFSYFQAALHKTNQSFSPWLWGMAFCAIVFPAHAQEFHPLAYAPAPVDNPLKGFVPYDNAPGKANFPYSLEWFYIPLSNLMSADKTFNWAPMERHFAAIAARGHQAVMRVYLDYPGQTPGIPKFLLDEGLKTQTYDGRKNNGKSLTPDYEDPRLRTALKDFIAAFGAKYDGDPRIGFITIGLLGYWGEWHTSDFPERFASKTVQTEVMDAYANAFHKTKLLVRYPAGPSDSYYADNHAQPMGYHDDSFSWDTLPVDKKTNSYFMGKMQLADAMDRWKTQPIGGEVRPEIFDTLFDDPTGAPKGQEFGPCLEATHATWLMNSGVFRTKFEGAKLDRALAGARRMGYELMVTAAALTVKKDGGLDVKIKIRNAGVAPFYYSWPVEIGLLDSTGKVATTWRTDWDLTGILPGPDSIALDFTQAKLALPTGEYQVVMRAVNPLPNGVPLRFANQTQDANTPGWLSLGQVQF